MSHKRKASGDVESLEHIEKFSKLSSARRLSRSAETVAYLAQLQQLSTSILQALAYFDTDLADEQSLSLVPLYIQTQQSIVSIIVDYREHNRMPHVPLLRRTWEEYRQEKEDQNLFHRLYRVTSEQFDEMFALIRAKLETTRFEGQPELCPVYIYIYAYFSFQERCMCNHRNTTSNIPVAPEQRLAITLRFLAGGQALDLVDMAPVGLSTIYAIVWKTIAVINECKELEYKFDISPEACKQRAEEFRRRSSAPEAFANCVGAIDGLFIRINGRCVKETNNPRAFFSGHKHGHGLNLQVVCDAYCRVLDASCNTPGFFRIIDSLIFLY